MEKVILTYSIDSLESLGWLSKMLDKWKLNHPAYDYTIFIGPTNFVLTLSVNAVPKEN